MRLNTLALLLLAALAIARAQDTAAADPSAALDAATLLLVPSPSPSGPATISPAASSSLNCTSIMPGCTDCYLTTSGSSSSGGGRKLKAALDLSSLATSITNDFITPAYQQPSNFMCQACNASAGYKFNPTLGRCGEGRPVVNGLLLLQVACVPCAWPRTAASPHSLLSA